MREGLTFRAGIIHDKNAALTRNKRDGGGDIIFHDGVGAWIKWLKDGLHAHHAGARQRHGNGDHIWARVKMNLHRVAVAFGIQINRLSVNFKANSPVNWATGADDHFCVDALTTPRAGWRAQRFDHCVVGCRHFKRHNVNGHASRTRHLRGLENISRCLVAVAHKKNAIASVARHERHGHAHAPRQIAANRGVRMRQNIYFRGALRLALNLRAFGERDNRQLIARAGFITRPILQPTLRRGAQLGWHGTACIGDNHHSDAIA